MTIISGKVVNYPVMSVANMFLQVCHRVPNKQAIIFGGEALSYSDLAKKSSGLAEVIKRTTAEKSSPLRVGLYVNRGFQMAIGTFGIFMSDSIYVPFDPAYPRDRLEYIIKEVKLDILITEKALYEEAKILTNSITPLVLIDDVTEALVQDYNPTSLSPSTPAYILYTSGSTGNPKGVEVNVGGVCNYVSAVKDAFHLAETDVYMHTSSVSFSSSIRHLIVPILNEVLVVITSYEERLDSEAYLSLIKKYDVTIVDVVPSYMINLLDYLSIKPQEDAEKLLNNKLRLLVIGSEPVTFSMINRCRKYFKKNIEIVNILGGTELSGVVAHYYVPGNPISEAKTVPIGMPMANSRFYVIDEASTDLCGFCDSGELYVAGPALANGYINADLNKQKFIDTKNHPKIKEDRLYKTGDLVRVLSDGNLEHLGRADRQVKIRGMRVEISEIEFHINQYPHVKRSIVLLKEVFGNQKLVAYVACEKNIKDESIRDYLLKKIPEYMLPEYFVMLEKFPLSPNGKIDVIALPLPANKKEKNNGFIPQNEDERSLLTIWQEVLGVETIALDDNFFHIGGNSLLATQLISRAKQKFDFNMKVIDFFSDPSFSSMLDLVANRKHSFKSIKLAEQDANYNVKNDISSLPVACLDNPKKILLTGSTGFLGIHLLVELLEQTNATIYCIVRGKSEADIKHKFFANMEKYGISMLDSLHRVELVLGSLDMPRLGQSQETWDAYASSIDTIYHCGANVNHLYDYRKLKKENVDSTIELLNLATTKKIKHIHFISTKKAANQLRDNLFRLEQPPSDRATALDGYTLTKWVSERILWDAFQNKVPVTIYRPGNIGGNSMTGASNFQNNHALLLLKGCIQIAVAPDWDYIVELAPVDILSKGIVALSLKSDSQGKFYNLSNPQGFTWREYITLLNQSGYTLKLVDSKVWVRDYVTKLDETNSLYPLKSFYLDDNEKDKNLVDCHESQLALKKMNISYPKKYRELIALYINYLKKNKFLPLPKVRMKSTAIN